MSARVLSSGEITPGQFVTPLDEIPEERDRFGKNNPLMVEASPFAQRRWLGVPFKVRVVDLPFVLLEDASGNAVTFNTRRFTFMELKPEFWQTAVKQSKQQAGELGEVQSAFVVVLRDLSRRVGVIEAATLKPSLWSRLRSRFTARSEV